MSDVDRLADLLARMMRAEAEVKRLSRSVSRSTHGATERVRLDGKVEGLRVAVSYVREALHDAEQEANANVR